MKALWKPQMPYAQQFTETGRYTNAFFCRKCSVFVRKECAVGATKNYCPCCHFKMRCRRMNDRKGKAERLGYDYRDRTRIDVSDLDQ